MSTRSVPVYASRSFRAASLRALCFSLLALAAAASCSSAKDTEAFVPSMPGAVQPDTNGTLVDEATACSKLTKAESSARSDLGCEAAKHSCPDYIRPAGGAACFRYDEGSVEGCVKLFGTFTQCDDFEQHPCLLSAVSKCSDLGAAGEGGMGGMGGAFSLGEAGHVDFGGPAGAGGV
jgi:hypothetical protein